MIGVDDQVRHHLTDLSGIDFGRPEIRREGNTLRLCVPRSEKLTVSSMSLPIDAVFLIGAPPRAKVRSCWARSRARSEAFLASFSRSSFRRWREEERGERDVSDDRGQQVVEVVRDAAGEKPELLQRLGFAPLGFGALLR